jgi:hypothetical protein
MEVTTNIFICESDIREILTEHLKIKGYEVIEELEIDVRSKKDIPEGATPGDVVGINAKVKNKVFDA